MRRFLSLLKSTNIKHDKLFIFKINLELPNYVSYPYQVTLAKNIGDLEQILIEREDYFKEMYSRWFTNGYICFLVKDESKALGIVWLNNTDTVPLEFGYTQHLASKKEAGLIDAYVIKEKRGKGIYNALWYTALKETKKLGITDLYGYILDKNTNSLVVHYKLGMREIYQVLYYYRILWFNFFYLKHLKKLTDISHFKKFLRRYS